MSDISGTLEQETPEETGKNAAPIVLDYGHSVIHRLNEFQSKQIKYLQREISFLVRNNDPYRHLIDARFDILERAFLAKIRSRKRLEIDCFNNKITKTAQIEGIRSVFSKDAKIQFICYFFGRNDYFEKLKSKEQKELKDTTTDEHASDITATTKSKKVDRLKKRAEKIKPFGDKVPKDNDATTAPSEEEIRIRTQVIMLSEPEYCKHFIYADEFLEKLIALSASLPNELEALEDFESRIEAKRKKMLNELLAQKKEATAVSLNNYL
ncbi:hypothetical protein RFI_26920 [Reticulomyxa filosa]|uniref:Uncharacterized protein n=1 Tax=Reticulomyxa filosa TaxID=46433 RepID=X6MBP2_RETFI|nr:hypothetical protein RFI_26920 [Reticulomyxa filosa]|eukprot:ETO10455.1 hypothetical protein RFI_26920 [Reticulomyxa filosa]